MRSTGSHLARAIASAHIPSSHLTLAWFACRVTLFPREMDVPEDEVAEAVAVVSPLRNLFDVKAEELEVLRAEEEERLAPQSEAPDLE